jgi:predicted phosphodiesterase
VEDIRKTDVDEIICLGDVATLGPQPNECMELLGILNCQTIMGNHESALLKPEKAAFYKIAEAVIPSLLWCKKQLSLQDIDFIRSFKPAIDYSIGRNNKILLYHGSPESNTDNILPNIAEEKLQLFFAHLPHKAFAGGHTHIQMMRLFNGKPVINPGSVGIPFLQTPQAGDAPSILPCAEYAVLDISEKVVSADLKTIQYDVTELMNVLKKSDNPLREWWIEQFGKR